MLLQSDSEISIRFMEVEVIRMGPNGKFHLREGKKEWRTFFCILKWTCNDILIIMQFANGLDWAFNFNKLELEFITKKIEHYNAA